jgi:hypothetical protein
MPDLRGDGGRFSPRPRGNLKHRIGAAAPGQAARRNLAPDLDYGAPAVEEIQVEGEAHPKGVDAGAARNQQAGSGLITIEPREAEQAGGPGGRDRNEEAADAAAREPTEAIALHP